MYHILKLENYSRKDSISELGGTLRLTRMFLFFIAFAILVMFCLDNKEFVNINIGFNSLGDKSALTIDLPIFMVVILAIAFGFFLGSISEFFRQQKGNFKNRGFLKSLKADSDELKQLKKEVRRQGDD